MRSPMASTSSRSSEISSTAAPASRAAISCRCTKLTAPMSRPQVGWCATIRHGVRPSGASRARPRISFCMLPPESARVGVSGPPPRTSNACAMRCACSRAARRHTHMPREKLVRSRSATAFSHTGRSPTTPVPCRSSGMRATPRSTSHAGSARSGAPSSVMRPARTSTVPHSRFASVSCPLPETPAIAVISPARSASVTCSSRSRPAPASTTSNTQTASPTEFAGERCGGATAWPTIHCASWACVVCAAVTSATSRAARSTTMRCETRSTSASLWLMKMIDRPCATICASVANSASASSGVSTAVGSSRIRIRAPRYSAFRISTRWRSPTDRLPTRASGATCRPKRAPTASRRVRAASLRVKGCHSDSLPSITLSRTVRLSASVKCWCTMPMPAASAALGLPGGSGRPNTSMVPASAV